MNGLKTNILTDRKLENDSLELDEFLENTAQLRRMIHIHFIYRIISSIITPVNQSQLTTMKTKYLLQWYLYYI